MGNFRQVNIACSVGLFLGFFSQICLTTIRENLSQVIYIAWERAHEQYLKRGWKATGQTIRLPRSKRTNRIYLLPADPLGKIFSC